MSGHKKKSESSGKKKGGKKLPQQAAASKAANALGKDPSKSATGVSSGKKSSGKKGGSSGLSLAGIGKDLVGIGKDIGKSVGVIGKAVGDGVVKTAKVVGKGAKTVGRELGAGVEGLMRTYNGKDNARFVKVFGLPEDEKLIGDWSASLHYKMDIRGRVFVSEHYLCFYANLFGMESVEVIPLHTIRALQPARSAVIKLPNSIRVTTVSPPRVWFFTGFISRTNAYYTIRAAWRRVIAELDKNAKVSGDDESGETLNSGLDMAVADKVAPPSTVSPDKHIWELLEEEGVTGEDGEEGKARSASKSSKGSKGSKGKAPAAKSSSSGEEEDDPFEGFDWNGEEELQWAHGEGSEGEKQDSPAVPPEPAAPEVPAAPTAPAAASTSTAPAAHPLPRSLFQEPVPHAPGTTAGKPGKLTPTFTGHKAVKDLRLIGEMKSVARDVDDIFRAVLATPQQYSDILVSRECKPDTIGNWEQTKTPGVFTRSVKYVAPMDGSIGPSATRISETHHYQFLGEKKLVFTTRAVLHDIPLGNRFVVVTRLDLVGEPGHPSLKCKGIFHVAPVFLKSTPFKDRIRNGIHTSYSGVLAGYKAALKKVPHPKKL